MTATDTATTHATDHAPDTTPRDVTIAYLIAATIVGLWAGAVAIWGLPALGLGALTLVPIIWIVLLVITVGK